MMSLLCIAMAQAVLRVALPVSFGSEVRLEMTQNLPGLESPFVFHQDPWGFRSLSMHSA